MPKNVPEKIKTKLGHKPRARVHSTWSPIGVRNRRTALIRGLGFVLVLVLVAGLGVDAYAQTFFDGLPSIKGLDTAAFAGDTVIYDSGGPQHGTLLADVGDHGDHRQAVKLNQIAPKMIQATIAIEDKDFYKNPGFDWYGIVRAAFDNLRAGHVVSGASTITQQLAKQQFLTPDRTVDRKLKELALAYELSQTYSKDQILELYLNKSFYGSQSYGVEAASRSYFHLHASELDLAQSAVLAGLPQAPTEWNPVLNPDAARTREREVLQAMVRSGYITADDMDKAYAEQLTYQSPINSFLAPHFVDYVQQELGRLGFKSGQQQLIVTTTLNYALQQQAEQIVRDNLSVPDYQHGSPDVVLEKDTTGRLSSAVVAEDPKTGNITVMVGSPDYNAPGGQFNWTTEPRNMGSSTKPYNYGEALNARAATVDTPIYDGPSPLIYKDAYSTTEFRNFDGLTHGVLPLKVAFENSLTIPAVKTELSYGTANLVDFMRNLGILPRVTVFNADGSSYRITDAPHDQYGPSLTLGGYPFTMLEHVGGLATYADMGIYHTPEAIQTVTDAHGNVLYQNNPDARARQAIDPGLAFIMAQIMSDDNNRALLFGFNSRLHFPDHQVAAKTGTADGFKDVSTIGFTPDVAAVYWVGDILGNEHAMNFSVYSDAYFVAAPGWHKFMEAALAGVPDHWYTPPGDVVAGPNNSWYFQDTTSITHLAGDSQPSPTPTPIVYVNPANPNVGPTVAHPTPSPGPSPCRRPPCSTPTPSP